jgi:putative ATPase
MCKDGRTIPVPKHLKDAHYAGAQRLEHGTEYKYPHDHPSGFVEQEYLGVDKTYYEPSDRGYEAEIRRRMQERMESQSHPEPGSAQEI